VVATGCPLIGGAAWSLVQDRSPRPSLSPGTLSRKCRHGLAEKARDRRRVEVEHLGASELFRGGSDRGRGLGYRVAAPRKSRPSAARERLPRHYETPRFVAPSGALARSASDPTSPTTAIFSRRKKYCPNGGWPSPPSRWRLALVAESQRRGDWSGSAIGIVAPSWLPGSGQCAGEKVWGPQIRLLWGAPSARLPARWSSPELRSPSGRLSMIALPLPFIRSLGVGGMLIPAVSVLAALTLLPALLATSARGSIASGCVQSDSSTEGSRLSTARRSSGYT
jgi:hypothetical protein